MKIGRRMAGILRRTGITLILIALVLGLYNVINIGGAWTPLNNRMAAEGVSSGAMDRLAFDDAYFSALSRAFASRGEKSENRAEALRPFFARHFTRLREAEQEARAAQAQETLTWLAGEADLDALLARAESLEDGEDERKLQDIFEYIDGLTAAPKKGKLAGLKTASQEPWFREYFESFAAEQGEDAGTFAEFMTCVRRMIETEIEGGNAVKDPKAWMESGFTLEGYAARLAELRGEEATETQENFLALLASALETAKTGEKADWEVLTEGALAALEKKYPGEDLGGREIFLITLRPLLEDAGFQGSYNEIAAAMRTEKNRETTEGVQAFETVYLTDRVAEADNRVSISAVAVFWAVTAKYLWICGAGILLIILSAVTKKIVRGALLKRQEKAGIQEEDDVLLRVSHLKQYFRSGDYINKAVDDVSFYVKKGEVFGLVGESGCGKTTTGRTIINLYDPTEGDVYFNGLRISSTMNGLPVLRRSLRNDYRQKLEQLKKENPADLAARKKQLKEDLRIRLRDAETHALESEAEKSKCVEKYREKRLKELTDAYERGRQGLSGAAAEELARRYETEKKVAAKDQVMTRMQMIFQDPIASINPRMTVREIIAEGMVIRGITDKEYIDRKVYEMLELVGLVREHADRYPHEFSGGQRQRIGIARAIVMEPELIIADEPISALDVSIQAQVINLLNDLRNRMGLTIMFIAHNLSVVKYFSDRIAVMYYGKIVEMTTSEELFAHPLHPYTKSLLSAIPYPDPHYEKVRQRVEYHPEQAHDYSVQQPTLRELKPGHWVMCNDAEAETYRKELEEK